MSCATAEPARSDNTPTATIRARIQQPPPRAAPGRALQVIVWNLQPAASRLRWMNEGCGQPTQSRCHAAKNAITKKPQRRGDTEKTSLVSRKNEETMEEKQPAGC